MPGAVRERQPNDRPWDRVAPLPPPRPSPRGAGRPFADDRACFEGIVYVLRDGLRWRLVPAGHLSGVTRRRRHRDGTAAGVWDDARKLVPGEWPRPAGADELVVDRHGIPLGAATDGAGGHEVNLAPVAPADVPVGLPMPWPVPVLADRAYDSDPLQGSPADDGFELVARHRSNHTRPAAADGRGRRRLEQRWVVGRSFAWLERFRRLATRYGRRCRLYDGFVLPARTLLALDGLLRNQLPRRRSSASSGQSTRASGRCRSSSSPATRSPSCRYT